MTIETTTRTLHLVPHTPRRGKVRDISAPPRVSIALPKGILVFGRPAIEQLNMEGRFVRLFCDSGKNIIAWQVKEGGTLGEMKSWKICKPDPKIGQFRMSVGSILSQFSNLTQKSYKKLEVKRYRTQNNDLLGDGQYFYYVEVKNPVV